MFDRIGGVDGAAKLMQAVKVATSAVILTPDVGGIATTEDVTDAVIKAIRSSNPGREFVGYRQWIDRTGARPD